MRNLHIFPKVLCDAFEVFQISFPRRLFLGNFISTSTSTGEEKSAKFSELLAKKIRLEKDEEDVKESLALVKKE